MPEGLGVPLDSGVGSGVGLSVGSGVWLRGRFGSGLRCRFGIGLRCRFGSGFRCWFGSRFRGRLGSGIRRWFGSRFRGWLRCRTGDWRVGRCWCEGWQRCGLLDRHIRTVICTRTFGGGNWSKDIGGNHHGSRRTGGTGIAANQTASQKHWKCQQTKGHAAHGP